MLDTGAPAAVAAPARSPYGPYISRPLPRACAPLPGETIESFLRRLADANVMDPEYLRALAAGDDHKDALPRVPVLARLSGRPERTLLRALPELTPPGPVPAPGGQLCWSTGPGCRLCNAARGAAKPVRVWHAVEDVLCCRHLRWTAASIGYYSEKQPDLAGQPEILAARRSYRRMARAHGRETARSAYLTATWIIDEWRHAGFYDYARTDGFSRRMTKFLGPRWRVDLDFPLAAAARYPQAVALARLLASPYWVGLAVRDHVAAGRPDKEQRELVARAVREYRHTALIAGRFAGPPTPDHLAGALAATYLLTDGPGLRSFLAELRRTVEPRYAWSPYPRNFLWDDLKGAGRCDPLVDLINDRVQAERAKLAG
jgi:hypothetical protein